MQLVTLEGWYRKLNCTPGVMQCFYISAAALYFKHMNCHGGVGYGLYKENERYTRISSSSAVIAQSGRERERERESERERERERERGRGRSVLVKNEVNRPTAADAASLNLWQDIMSP
jgi:hypothetical protein